MKKTIPIALSLLLCCGCNLMEVPSDMFTLDKAFITVWLPAQIDQWQEVDKAFPAFDQQWNYFQNKYKKILKTENQMETVRLLEQWIDDADHCLNQKDGICLKVKLDQFKFEMQEIRGFWEADYYLDYIWEFEENLNQFIAISTDPKLNLLQWNEFMPYLKAINSAFDRLESKELDPEFLNFDIDKLNAYHSFKDDIATRLECLNGLTEGAQIEDILECALGIQKVTYQMIALFADISFQNDKIY